MVITLGNELKCDEFKTQFTKFDYLWKKDLQTALQEFLAAEVGLSQASNCQLFDSLCCYLKIASTCSNQINLVAPEGQGKWRRAGAGLLLPFAPCLPSCPAPHAFNLPLLFPCFCLALTLPCPPAPPAGQCAL